MIHNRSGGRRIFVRSFEASLGNVHHRLGRWQVDLLLPLARFKRVDGRWLSGENTTDMAAFGHLHAAKQIVIGFRRQTPSVLLLP